MKKVLFSLLTVMLVMSSCGADPTKFNDAIVKANESVLHIQSSYENEVSSAIQDERFSEISAKTDSALAKIDVELDIVKALDAPKGADAFKDASVKTFESVRAVVEAGGKFASLTKESSEKDFDAIEKEYTQKINDYSKVFDELAKAQTEYAATAGYKVK